MGHPKIRFISEEEVYVKGLIYGEPGAGKTYLAATAPKPLLLLTESDVSKTTLRKVRQDLGVDIPIWSVSNLDDLAEAFQFLREDDHDFETVVLDGITDLSHAVMRGVIEEGISRKPHRDPDIPELSDYYKSGERLRMMFRAFRDLPMHVVFTALVAEVRDEMLRIPLTVPKSLGREVAAYCNLVGYLAAVREDEAHVRKLLVQPTEGYIAKNPGGCLPPVVDAPNLTEIFNCVKGGLDLNGR